jgi:uncharacterized protein YndB with AHSA1/START domain
MAVSVPALWSPVEVRQEIAASPEEVFAVLADPRTYPVWLVGAQRIRAVDPDFPAQGTEFDHSVGPTKTTSIDDSSEVLESEPPHRLSLLVHAGPLHARVDLLVLPAKDGTELRFRERPTGWGAALTPLLRLSLHARNLESVRRLAGLVEGRSAATKTRQ